LNNIFKLIIFGENLTMSGVGNKIKKIRELRNFSQNYIADQLGITQATYSKIENDEIDINISRLNQISKTLGVRVEDIFAFDEKFIFQNFSDTSTANGILIQNGISTEEKKLYESQLQQLREEIHFLKKIIESKLI
jgi:transcriptional regulator with XRE-family HTH domain